MPSHIDLFKGVLKRIGATDEEVTQLFQSEAPPQEFIDKYSERLNGLMTFEAAKSNDDLHKHFTGSKLSSVDQAIMTEARERYKDLIPGERFDQINGAKSIQTKVIAMMDEASKAVNAARQNGSHTATQATKELKETNETLRNQLAEWEVKYKSQAQEFEDERISDTIRRELVGKKWAVEDPGYIQYIQDKTIQEVKGMAKIVRGEDGTLRPMSKTVEGHPFYLEENQSKPASLSDLIHKSIYPHIAKSGTPKTEKTAGADPPKTGTESAPTDRAAELLRKQRERTAEALNRK